ncbi:DapH/DapD/GlmU-related protein [Nonlabens agnitus]|uniref:PglD N-terminal domain-containing protein n=1 Tax=Nonlabens agnitus TaxID=870484 RepID=A0A2S9WTW5_9FLAO|nr:DapH/DapD/GlmU-related protein [Nonlabens agnitus]PRP66918.1 hypothetical protein BST86_07310 [Nonlabens agnitus]
MINKKLLIIFGLESTAVEIEEAAHLSLTNYTVTKLLYSEGLQSNSHFKKLIENFTDISYIISFTNADLRFKCETQVLSLPALKPLSIIHPKSYISTSAQIGAGCYIAANAVVSSNARLENHVMVNFNASIGHDAHIKKHVSLLPGARVSGNTIIGEGSVLGSNSFIFQGCSIGRNNVIDALTAIHKNMDDDMISAARVTKSFKQIKR